MCSIDYNKQKKVFSEISNSQANSQNPKAEALKRLYLSGILNRKGELTPRYRSVIIRAK